MAKGKTRNGDKTGHSTKQKMKAETFMKSSSMQGDVVFKGKLHVLVTSLPMTPPAFLESC